MYIYIYMNMYILIDSDWTALPSSHLTVCCNVTQFHSGTSISTKTGGIASIDFQSPKGVDGIRNPSPWSLPSSHLLWSCWKKLTCSLWYTVTKLWKKMEKHPAFFLKGGSTISMVISDGKVLVYQRLHPRCCWWNRHRRRHRSAPDVIATFGKFLGGRLHWIL